MEQTRTVTFKGQPLTLVGKELKVDDPAPDAELTANDFSTVKLSDYAGKTRLFNVVYSLETSICDAQTHKFNQEASELGGDVVVLTISADLPFTQKRWCGASGLDNVITLSDHKTMAFSDAYGTHIQERRVTSRAVFVVDRGGIVRYVEYLPEIATHPNYDAALQALKQVAGA
jgi:thioredoxin-dependent peroxiredoxin